MMMMIVCVLGNKWVMGKLDTSVGNHFSHVSFPLILYVPSSIFKQYSYGGEPLYFTSKFSISPYWSHKFPETVTSVNGSKHRKRLRKNYWKSQFT